MMLKLLVVVTFLFGSSVFAGDYLFSLTGKYGPNGYNTSTTTSNVNSTLTNTVTKNNVSSTSTATTSVPSNSTTVTNRYQAVPGLRLQTIPDSMGGLSVGAGYYFDNTLEASIGIRF